MTERTNEYFTIPLVNAIVIGWINPIRGEYLGDRPWYREGRIVSSNLTEVVVWENGYRVTYQPKGYYYHNITNRPECLERFLNNVARNLEGARHVNFYKNKGPKPRPFLFRMNLD
jgi:hypothetical protein